MSKIFTVTGATGNIGSAVVARLLAEGHKVRAIGRDGVKLAPFVEQGADAFVGDLHDKVFLAKAFEGADGVFLMIPPHAFTPDVLAFQQQIAEAEVAAVVKSGVKQVVLLSSVGAHLAEEAGVVHGLHIFENLLNQLEQVDVLALRAAYFMENALGTIPLIKSAGINGSPLRSDIAFPTVATKDIAEAVATRLAEGDFSGKQMAYVLGTRDLTMPEMTAILGAAIGKPELPYIQFSYEDMKQAFLGYGMSESFVNAMLVFQKSLNEGLIIESNIRTAENTTPTSFEEFAQVFAAIYNS